jgi:transposase
VVEALQALRGIELISAATFLAEIGGLSRFPGLWELMAYLGLVPSADSTGDSIKRAAITKAGDRRVRHTLAESPWGYQYPIRVGDKKRRLVERAPRRVREIAWKAQVRLCSRI